jgi:hypothetical protein
MLRSDYDGDRVVTSPAVPSGGWRRGDPSHACRRPLAIGRSVPVSDRRSDRLTAAREGSRRQSSDAPWLARKDWAAGTLRDNVALRPEIYILAFVGPVFLAIAVGGTYSIVNDWLHSRPPSDPGVVLVALFFGLAGFGLTFRSVQLIWRWLVHGGSRLKLASVPIPLGGALRAELVTARRIPADRAVRATLKCMSATVSHPISINRTYSTREDWSISHHVVWQDEDMIASDGSGRLPIAFAVPADQPETTPATMALLDLGNCRSGRPAAGLSSRVRAAGLRRAVGHRRGGGRGDDPGGQATQASGLPA